MKRYSKIENGNNFYYQEDQNGFYTKNDIIKFKSDWKYNLIPIADRKEIIENFKGQNMKWLYRYHNIKALSKNHFCCDSQKIFVLDNYKFIIQEIWNEKDC